MSIFPRWPKNFASGIAAMPSRSGDSSVPITTTRLPIAASFEPAIALDGGPQGLSLIHGLMGRLPDALEEGGVALLEIGADQADAIETLAHETLPGWRTEVALDLAGQPRVARLEPPRRAGS